ncbi:acyltransferase family protein [Arthrobacter cavernae]|uniref:Acyltransferase n=1 Tax=Arthrobacter cavernae TaxID=2817681 RepID=A0A939HD83_9MICC|nr:acyltransferase [Arthrobacter cavernae]MBO1267711.1 acyltransferase [Arthrobacter cavernae]
MSRQLARSQGPNAATAKTAGAASGRLPGLEGTRGLLALMVVLVHTAALLTPGVTEATKVGYLGNLIVFFHVLSAFFIYMPFLSALVDGKKFPSVSVYAVNRGLRVFPAYIVAFAVANFIFRSVYVTNAYETSAPRTDQGSGMITDPITILLHLTLLQNYLPSGLQTGINPSWTLTMEIAFYLVLPLLSLGCFALRKRTTWSPWLIALLPAAIFLVVGVACRIIAGLSLAWLPGLSPLQAEWGANWHAVFARSLFLWSDNFAFGLAAAVLYVAFKRGLVQRLPALRLLLAAALVLGLIASAATLLLQPRYLPTVLSAASAVAVLLLVLPNRGGNAPFAALALDIKPLKYLGDISLSIYLWHYPVLLLVTRWGTVGGDTLAGAAWNYGLVTVITVALAALSYHLVEMPAMKLRPRLIKKPAASAEASTPVETPVAEQPVAEPAESR